MVESSISAVSKDVDIELFVKSEGTGQEIKQHSVIYKPYKSYY